MENSRVVQSTPVYFRTKKFTDWPEKMPPKKMSIKERILKFFLISASDYEKKMHLVWEWLIEFENGIPRREIGLDANRTPILAGPDERNDGFWAYTNIHFKDFLGESERISEEEFEQVWNQYWNPRGGWTPRF